MFARIEVAMRPEYADPAAASAMRRLELAHPDVRKKVRWCRMIDVYWLDMPCSREELIPACTEIFWDRVLQWLFTGNLIPSAAGKHGGVPDLMESAPIRPGHFWALERRFRPGVTDNIGRTTMEAFEIVLGRKLTGANAASGSLMLLEGPELNEEILGVIARDVLCNELIETWTLLPDHELRKNDRFHQERVKRDVPQVTMRKSGAKAAEAEPVRLDGLSDLDLETMSRKRLWAFSVAEMRAVRDHFSDPKQMERRKSLGLSLPTDVELEVIAQTWSEHCKHKIFGAQIKYKDSSAEKSGPAADIPHEIDSVFKTTIVGTTEQLPKSWLLSVFEDNAGIVAFDDDDAFCIKVETHNSPSALDPYGGALTGIVGVNRDILGCGLGAKPIFNTDVFCVATPDYSQTLPERLLHPRRILDGVRRGVEHGGNKSGIPTINGALVFDDRYLGKPLIYCGTGGFMPRMIGGTSNARRCEVKEIVPGDRIVMIGGRIGKDGIHGATFSSLALDESSPVSAVQLGDPITQKRVADFLLEARDMGIYRGLTDNGAGGLSSSVGELAQLSGGATMDVGLARTKYPGLKPYELVVSESQERMTIAVPRESLSVFMALAERRGVEASDLGEFTDSGTFEIFYNQKRVASLDLEFLHKGLPRLQLTAEWTGRPKSGTVRQQPFEDDGPKKLLEILGRPNIASKEWLIRQYDHEVQGASVIKPLHTFSPGTPQAFSGPNDAGVVKPKATSTAGIAVGCGINPKLSDVDPFLMAQAAVDEAIRNILCVGAEFGQPESLMALVDNFCWPDPVGDPLKTAWLVRACYGLRDAAMALGVPLVSGKDSMKNDFKGRRDGKDVVISVPPTLLMTAIGRVPDIRLARTADFKNPSDSIYLIGGNRLGLVGSEFQAMGGAVGMEPRVGEPDWKEAYKIYGWLGGAQGKEQSRVRSLHDVSEGGILTAVVESLLARGLGAAIRVPDELNPWDFGFGEGFHSFIASVGEADVAVIESEWNNYQIPYKRLGLVTSGERLEVSWESKNWAVDTKRLRAAWRKEGYWE